MRVKCNKCGHVAEEADFPKGRDFCGTPYVKACPKCDNATTPGDASMRMFDRFGKPAPFVYVDRPRRIKDGDKWGDAVKETLDRAGEAS